MTGSIPSEIFRLTQLETIVLKNNNLVGSISTDIGSMINLKSLSFSLTKLDGSIPSEIGLLTKLTLLNLAMNNFVGTIPSDLARLTNIKQRTGKSLQNRGIVGPVDDSLCEVFSVIRICPHVEDCNCCFNPDGFHC